jgi:hypothetical protein
MKPLSVVIKIVMVLQLFSVKVFWALCADIIAVAMVVGLVRPGVCHSADITTRLDHISDFGALNNFMFFN